MTGAIHGKGLPPEWIKPVVKPMLYWSNQQSQQNRSQCFYKYFMQPMKCM